MEEKLREFLIARNAVSPECLAQMESEKIDIETIMEMSSEELKPFIPACGDRMAVINFCRRHSNNTNCTNRTLSLLEKLKRGQKSLDDESIISKKVKDHSIARRSLGRKPQPTRKIQLGWILNGVPVRQKKGGGSREVSVNKSATKADVLEIAKDLFFPLGKSYHGMLKDYECDLLDFQHSVIDEKLTVGEIYNITKINVLRFYLVTHKRKKQSQLKSKIKKAHLEFSKVEPNIKETHSEGPICHPKNISSDISEFVKLYPANISTSAEITFIDLFEKDGLINLAPDVNAVDQNNCLLELDTASTANVQSTDSEIFDVLFDHSTMPQDVILLRIHRGRVFEELMHAFELDQTCCLKKLKIEMVLPNGDIERAEDQGGVLRDALTEFWETFYAKCTVGVNVKVPYLRHDFGEIQWKSVAKILVDGYMEHKYFPIKLAPVFIDSCLGHMVEDTFLIDNFKKYVSEAESETIDVALENFNSSNDDILDFFTTYDSKWFPQASNVYQLVRDIAHKELIQKPAFVIKCFMKEFKMLDAAEIKSHCEKLKPSARNCLNQIIFDSDGNAAHKVIFGYLKKFIKESDDKGRSLFCRFCTGSDLPTNQIKITIDDRVLSEFERTPVAHTCSGMLVLPVNYENYVDFRNDFNSILLTNIWVMDII